MPGASDKLRLAKAFNTIAAQPHRLSVGAPLNGPCGIVGAYVSADDKVVVERDDGTYVTLSLADAEAYLVGAAVLWMIDNRVEGFFGTDEQGVACLESQCKATGTVVNDEDIRELRDGRFFFERCAWAVHVHRAALATLTGELDAEAAP